MNTPDLKEFVAAAEEFCDFSESDREPLDGDLWKIRELLLRLIHHIPAVESADHDYEYDAGEVADEVFKHAIKRFLRLPIFDYLVMFDPHTSEIDEKPVMGMLPDDLSDIYRDLAGGLINWKTGMPVTPVSNGHSVTEPIGPGMRFMP